MKVQLIHLDGPFKGEIQDFFEEVISIGRHPDCQLVFPKECATISRRHGEIRREGNRFKYVDNSANGTLINGKPQKDVFLKDGDVLIIGGEGGPKVSFISSELAPGEEKKIPLPQAVPEKAQEQELPSQSAKPAEVVSMEKIEPPQTPPPAPPSFLKPPTAAVPSSSSLKPPAREKKESIPVAAKNLIIQYGATLTSFNQLPITIGSGANCDCTLQHPALLEQHAQIFFQDDQYRVKDLTGRGLVRVNQQPVQSDFPLLPDSRLALTPTGPVFQFLGDGRLAEIEAPTEKPSPATRSGNKKTTRLPGHKKNRGGNGWLWISLLLAGAVLAGAAWYFLPASTTNELLGKLPTAFLKPGR